MLRFHETLLGQEVGNFYDYWPDRKDETKQIKCVWDRCDDPSCTQPHVETTAFDHIKAEPARVALTQHRTSSDSPLLD